MQAEDTRDSRQQVFNKMLLSESSLAEPMALILSATILHDLCQKNMTTYLLLIHVMWHTATSGKESGWCLTRQMRKYNRAFDHFNTFQPLKILKCMFGVEIFPDHRQEDRGKKKR